MEKKYILLLILIFIFAFFLRSYNISEYFASSDHVTMPLFVIDSFPNKLDDFFSINNYGMNNPLRLLVYPYSIIEPVYYFIFTWLFSIFNIPINEVSFTLLSAVIGALSVFFVYLTINKLYNKKYAIISSLVITMLPIHVMQSRYATSARVSSILLQFLALYYLINFFEKPDKNAFKLSVLFSLVILSSILSPPFFLMAIYTFIVYNKNVIKSYKKLKFYLIKNVFNLKLLTLPVLTLLFLIAIFLATVSIGSDYGLNVTMLGHFVTKEANYGFYLFSLLRKIIENIGLIPGIFLLLLIPFGLRDFFMFKKKGILLAWSFVYILPFLVTRPSPGAYIIHGIVPLAIYGIIKLCEILKSKLKIIVISIILILTLFSTISGTYNLKIFGLIDIKPGEGSFYKDYGVKAIGYWIRTNTNENAVIFTDETIEPPVGKYYFHRKIYGLFDSDTFDTYHFFLENYNKIDYIVVSKENYFLYKKKIFIVAESESNGEVYYILGKEKKNREIIDVEKYNKLYDTKFSNLKSIKNAPDYVSQFPSWM